MKVMLFALALLVPVFGLARADEAKEDSDVVWRIDFNQMPANWEIQGVPFGRKADFSVGVTEGMTQPGLLMTADNASATLRMKGAIPGVDLNKAPIMRWRWRVTVFPTGADGRVSAKDDQAIGIYVSTGGMLSQKSVAYRWETETPVGEEGNVKYARVVSVFWISCRDKDSGSVFFTEERNVADDFQRAFGSIPSEVGIGISCNSQHTGTKAAAQLEWIEFRRKPVADEQAAAE